MKKLIFLVFIFLITNTYSQKPYVANLKQVEKIVQESASFLNDGYKRLHEFPELSTKEINTAAFLKTTISSFGYSIVDSLGYQSFAAVLKNGKGPVIMYRTDMDGLPVKEETTLPFASKATGIKDNETFPVMQACGHDIHMSSWLGLAKVMSQMKSDWKGTIIFLAQSAEETAQGAKGIVKSDNYKLLPKANYQLAIHDHAELQVGEVGFCDEYEMAAVDMMNITIYGKGGHGAAPQRCIDPVLLSAHYITEIQSIISRNLPPIESGVITVGAINGGTIGNVIPNQVVLKLTIRTFSQESRNIIMKRLKEIGDNLAKAAGLPETLLPKYDLLDMSIPSVYNNPELGKKLKDCFNKYIGIGSVVKIKPMMIGEDFSVYGQQTDSIPSYILWMGTLSAERKSKSIQANTEIPALHTSKFAPDYEQCIPRNVIMMSAAMLELFNNGGK
jgi:hippurate hydrolase